MCESQLINAAHQHRHRCCCCCCCCNSSLRPAAAAARHDLIPLTRSSSSRSAALAVTAWLSSCCSCRGLRPPERESETSRYRTSSGETSPAAVQEQYNRLRAGQGQGRSCRQV
jgi:hypothetical protein